MKRAMKWLAAIVATVIVLGVAGDFALTAWIAHKKNEEAHSMHEGHVIVDAIKAHDPSINATWTTDERGQPDVVIRNVFDSDKQDAIIAWAKAVKSQGLVQRRIVMDFQKETPNSHIDDTILRTIEF
jgi:hypothetical protein